MESSPVVVGVIVVAVEGVFAAPVPRDSNDDVTKGGSLGGE